MNIELLDLDLIKRVYVSQNYDLKISAGCINMIIVSVYCGYYEKIIRLHNPLSIISTTSGDQKFAEGIKINTAKYSKIIKIFRTQDEEGKVLISTGIQNRDDYDENNKSL